MDELDLVTLARPTVEAPTEETTREARRTVVEFASEAESATRPGRLWLRVSSRSAWAIAASGSALVVLVVIVMIGLGATDPAFAVEELDDGRVHVEIYPQFDQAEALRTELSAAGVDVEVVALRAHPAIDGVIEFVSHDQQAAGAVQPAKGELIIEPDALTGPIEMLIYSTPDPDLRLDDSDTLWQASPSIFHPDEPLGGLNCAIEGPLSTGVLEEHATSVGITTIDWVSVDAPEATPRRPEGVVLGASMHAPEQLTVLVASAGPDASELSMDDGLHFTQRPTCTPQLADRWANR